MAVKGQPMRFWASSMSCTESCGHSEMLGKQEKDRQTNLLLLMSHLYCPSVSSNCSRQAQALDESAAGWGTFPHTLFLRLATARGLLKTKLLQNGGVSCCIQKGNSRQGSHITSFSLVLKKLIVKLQLVHLREE